MLRVFLAPESFFPLTSAVEEGEGLEEPFLATTPPQAHAHPRVGIEFDQGEKLVAGLFDRIFHPKPVEQRALGLLLAGDDFDQGPNKMGSDRRSAPFQL